MTLAAENKLSITASITMLQFPIWRPPSLADKTDFLLGLSSYLYLSNKFRIVLLNVSAAASKYLLVFLIELLFRLLTFNHKEY